jgi:hypothetical protein
VSTHSAILKRFSQGFLAFLMALLALGPFLHAHSGASHLSGFHLDGLTHAGLYASHDLDLSIHYTQDGDDESSAASITTSLTRQANDDDSQALDLDTLLSVLWLSSVSLVLFVLLSRQCRWFAPDVSLRYLCGFPPPAHAPPIHHI